MISLGYLFESQAWQRQSKIPVTTPSLLLNKANRLNNYYKSNPNKKVTSPRVGVGHISSYDVDKNKAIKRVSIGSKDLNLKVNQI